MSKSGDLFAKFGDAVRRRALPVGPFSVKQLAHAAGCSLNTFTRYWRGESRIPGEAIGNLARFFASGGDLAFLAEVYGDDVVCARFDAAILSVKHRIDALQKEFGDAPSFPRLDATDASVARGLAHDQSGAPRGEAATAVARGRR